MIACVIRAGWSLLSTEGTFVSDPFEDQDHSKSRQYCVKCEPQSPVHRREAGLTNSFPKQTIGAGVRYTWVDMRCLRYP